MPACRSLPARPFAAVALLLLLQLLLGGCGGVRAPQPSVAQLAIGEQGDEAVRVDVEVVLRNPGDQPLNLLRAEYEVVAGGARWKGQWSAQASIPRQGERRLVLPAVLPPEAIASAERWRIRGRVSWLEPGRIARVFYDAGLRRPRTSFSGSGEMPEAARAFPDARAPEPLPEDGPGG